MLAVAVLPGPGPVTRPTTGGEEIIVSYGATRLVVSPARRQSTLAALGLAAATAIVGAVLWGLVALVLHRQLLLLSLLIGAGVGVVVARYRPGHLPSIVTGAVIAVVGC